MNISWKNQPLDGAWHLFVEEHKKCASVVNDLTTIAALQKTDFYQTTGTVPGNFELDLVRDGILPDPFLGENPLILQKYEIRHLWYATTFTSPAKEGEDSDPYGAYTGEENTDPKKPTLNVAMETTVKSSSFERAMKLEAELNKIHGRIIKLLDSIKSYELEQRRIELEEKRYNLMKQKLSGVYDVDPDTGEINDCFEGEDEDLLEELNDTE